MKLMFRSLIDEQTLNLKIIHFTAQVLLAQM